MRFIFILLLFLYSLHAIRLEKTEIGVKLTAYNYTEYNTQGEILDTETSNNSIIHGVYMLNTIELYPEKILLEIRNEFSIGITKYTGSLVSGGSYGDYISSTNNTFQNSEFNLLFQLLSYEKIELYLSMGLGYHYWERTLSQSQNEIYTWLYTSISALVSVQIGSKRELTLSLMSLSALNPRMYADIPPIDLDDTFILGNTYGFGGELKYIEKMFSDQFLTLSVGYEYLFSGRSNDITTSQGVYTEPESQHLNLYMHIGFIFTSV